VNGPNIRVIEAPAFEPVSLEQAKQWLRVDIDDEDALVSLLIESARERAEEITGRAFVQRELEVVYDAFPANGAPIELPGAPLLSVQYIKWFDASGVQQTLEGSPEQWILDTATQPGRIQPLVGADWPSPDGRVGGVRIAFTCGYAFEGSPAEDAQRAAIPAIARNWMQVRIASFYENRGSLIVGGQFQQPPRDFVDGLLDGLIVRKRFA
jgi:uncharacterized phiE125 gp8 family phage protein